MKQIGGMLAAAALVSGPAVAKNPFAGAAPVAESELAAMTGRYASPLGLNVNFAVEITTRVDGQVALRSVMRPADGAVSVYVPPVTVPPVTVPTVTVPPVNVPPVTVPPVTVPTVNVPTPNVPPVNVPPVTVPSVNVPAVNVPTPNVAPVTVPPVNVPTVTVPPVTVPTVTVPPVTVPAVNIPTIKVPAITVPPVAVPAATAPTVTVPPALPPAATAPAVTVPSVSVPPTAPPPAMVQTVTAPSVLPAVAPPVPVTSGAGSVGSSALPSTPPDVAPAAVTTTAGTVASAVAGHLNVLPTAPSPEAANPQRVAGPSERPPLTLQGRDGTTTTVPPAAPTLIIDRFGFPAQMSMQTAPTVNVAVRVGPAPGAGEGKIGEAGQTTLMAVTPTHASAAAPMATAFGDVSVQSTVGGPHVLLVGPDLQIRHMIGSASTLVANTANNRAIDTSTVVQIDLPNLDGLGLGSILSRIDDAIRKP